MTSLIYIFQVLLSVKILMRRYKVMFVFISSKLDCAISKFLYLMLAQYISLVLFYSVDHLVLFYSVDHRTLWKILRHYGIPEKFIAIIQQSYYNSQTREIHNGELTPPFSVKTGVRQGCILSPMLFLLVIDWVMKTTTQGSRMVIQSSLLSQLHDLDFAEASPYFHTIISMRRTKSNHWPQPQV